MTYLFAAGKRKTAVARTRLNFKSEKTGIEINGKTYQEYFPYFESQQLVEQPLKKLNLLGKYFISIKVAGGGKHSQAEAVRHGISRVLLKLDETFRKTLRGEGLLTRDSRKKERKKPGLKRARRAPQWQKR
ncbi:MAG: 30S ribosomal protein S9 [Candidatus Komeilibacteria bacterium]|nr:30S ribosomal protein S9 [Candidatus Komeilibacteria bacterium]